MDSDKKHSRRAGFSPLIFVVTLMLSAVIGLRIFRASDILSPRATYSHGELHVALPCRATLSGPGELTLEVLDPEDHLLGKTTRRMQIARGDVRLQETVKLKNALPLDDLVWHRIHYRFQYDDKDAAPIEGTESISQILLRPVVHILAQQSYLVGSHAAARVIVTDSNNNVIPGHGSVRIELPAENAKPALLYTGSLNQRGTTEA